MKLTIGEKIALLRKEKNVTQTELAEYLFLTPQTVSRWEADGGTPDIALLPKIAAFFGVTIDELFGLTSLERTENLVAKYSVLRDDRSFREAMEYIDSQLQTIEALKENDVDNAAELEREYDQLKAEKTHMWIQLGREAFQRAFEIADSFVTKTEGDPEHPWYLPMRLQRDQLCGDLGRGRETLAERKKDFMEHPSNITLLRYLAMLSNRHEYGMILSLLETGGGAREIVFPPSEKNLDIWLEVINAAAEEGERGLIEQYLPSVLAVCTEKGELDFLMCLLSVYDGEELMKIKQHILALLPKAGLNEYFEEKVMEKIR